MTESKHSWTEQELWVVCICYKEKLPVDLALKLTNTTNAKSIEMRYGNCLFLEKGRVDGALSHPSKKHVEVWEKVQKLYENQEYDSESDSESEDEQPVLPKPKQEEHLDLCSTLLVMLLIMIMWSKLFH